MRKCRSKSFAMQEDKCFYMPAQAKTDRVTFVFLLHATIHEPSF